MAQQFAGHQPSHSQHFGAPLGAPGQPGAQNGNPQLQQISANVNEYRRLVENYKNSNSLVGSNSAPSPHLAQQQTQPQLQQQQAQQPQQSAH